MKNLQKPGGISALLASATYLFAMALAATRLMPLTDTALGYPEYISFLADNKTLVFVWHFAMYIVNGVCLVILALALRERLHVQSPRLASIATAFGLIWISFVFLSGLITIQGSEILLGLAEKDPAMAANLKATLDAITLSIDSSDKLLGCLWVGLSSLAAYKSKALPRILVIFGLVISCAGLIGALIPALIAVSYLFGIGAIIWWAFTGITMLRKPTL